MYWIIVKLNCGPRSPGNTHYLSSFMILLTATLIRSMSFTLYPNKKGFI